ncbi:MAG: serine--tRNA ligase, partial [Clostridia bacterium]|nr:serine--tRNA ligase [Clostridia bacterium]
MLDIRLITENPEYVKAALAKKGCEVDFTELLEKVALRKKLLAEVEQDKAQRNKVSAEIPKLKKQGLPVDDIFLKMRALGDEIAQKDAEVDKVNEEIFSFVSKLPNMPDDDLLPGEKENNKVIKVFGEKPEFSFEAKNHVDLCTANDLIDYERGVKLSGGGYWLYRGDGAR